MAKKLSPLTMPCILNGEEQWHLVDSKSHRSSTFVTFRQAHGFCVSIQYEEYREFRSE